MNATTPDVWPAAPAGDTFRFAFGRNWASFLTVLNEHRIAAAERSLQEMLQRDDLVGLRFLDIGSGSGLFSLAARRLGARVQSVDLDPDAVGCTRELRRRYFPGDPDWEISLGSALDAELMASLGHFDVVYSWGVLHHTGDMWRAIDLTASRVAPGGRLFIAIYNDAGRQTRRWTRIKRTYCQLPQPLRTPFALVVGAPNMLRAFARDVRQGQGREHIASWFGSRQQNRGMNRWHDLVDWVGGYPYQAARVDEVFGFLSSRGLMLTALKADGGLGCNEFVFQRAAV
ncbi:MAG: methyltransferase domain-containing protein [Vicinamibacterales bacterium]